MPRDIYITSTAVPGGSETITDLDYRLIDSDATTELSTADPPYLGVSDDVLYVEQVATQSGTPAKTSSVILVIAGRVADLAATDDAAPVLTWTDVAGETSYDVYRGVPDFEPDLETFSNRIATGVAANVEEYTDSAVTGDGATVYAYRLVAKSAFGVTIGNEAVCTPAAPASGATDYGFDDFEREPSGTELSVAGTPTWGGVVQVGLSWVKRGTPSAYIVSGRAAGDASGNAIYSLEGMTIPSADYEVASRHHRISALNYQLSILLGYDTGVDGYYRAALDISQLKFRIYRQHAGPATSQLLVTAPTALTWDVLTSKETVFRRVITGGNPVLTVLVDGVEHVTVTDPNVNKITSIGVAGFINAGNASNGFHLSDFRVRPLSV